MGRLCAVVYAAHLNWHAATKKKTFFYSSKCIKWTHEMLWLLSQLYNFALYFKCACGQRKGDYSTKYWAVDHYYSIAVFDFFKFNYHSLYSADKNFKKSPLIELSKCNAQTKIDIDDNFQSAFYETKKRLSKQINVLFASNIYDCRRNLPFSYWKRIKCCHFIGIWHKNIAINNKLLTVTTITKKIL